MKEKKKVFADGISVIDAVKRGGRLLRDKDSGFLRRVAYNAAVFAASLIFSSVEAGMGVYPFGAAVLCAASGPEQAAAAFSGAVLGTLGMQYGSLWQIIVLSAAFAARLCAGAAEGALKKNGKGLRGLFCEPDYVRVTVCAAAAAGAGIVGIVTGEGLYYSVFSAVYGLVMYPLSCAAFIFLTDRGAGASKRMAGVCVFALALSLAINSIALPFSPGIIFAFAGAIYLTWAGGTMYGASAGTALGLACGAVYAPMFTVSAVVFGLLCDYSSFAGVILAALCGTAWALATSGMTALTDIVPEICLSAAVLVPLLRFGVIPRELPPLLDISAEGDGEDTAEKKMLAAGGKYAAVSASLSSLSKMLYSVCDKMRCPTSQEAYRICTAARARYCCGCKHEQQCAGECEREVTSFFDNMSHRLSVSGRVSARIVPEELARRCYNMDYILDAVNTSAKRAAGMSSACQRTELFASDYTAIAGLMKEVAEAGGDWDRDRDTEQKLCGALSAEGFKFSGASVYGGRSKHIYLRGIDVSASSAGERDIRECAQRVAGCRLSSPEFSIDKSYISASMHTVPSFSVKSGRYCTTSVRDNASGDSVCSFKNREGYYYTLVSDGMGSGRDAAIISGISSVFLEKLLSAGCPMKSALEMLNCFVRGSEGERFTTVDLMEADLYTGRARFIKSGAAPSFVIRGGQLYRLHSKTVPIGIMRALDAEAISFDLCDGDTVIMMSDGVTGSYEECPWLYELLCSGLMDIDSPAAAARLIGEAAAKNTGRDDDITVCVMKVSMA